MKKLLAVCFFVVATVCLSGCVEDEIYDVNVRSTEAVLVA